MKKNNGMLEGLELITAWNNARAAGMTQGQHAADLGMAAKMYTSRLLAARVQYGKVETSRYPKYDKAFEIVGDALIMGDWHAPYHNAEFINNCINLAVAWGINTVIMGGDQADANAWSHCPL